MLPSFYSPGSRHPDPRFFGARSPGPPMPRTTLRHTPRDVPRKTRGQDGFATSFPAGTCTSTTCRFIPAHGGLPPTRKLPQNGGNVRVGDRAVQISCWLDSVGLLLLAKRMPRPNIAGKDLREPQGAPQIPPLRFASAGMTRGEGWHKLEL